MLCVETDPEECYFWCWVGPDQRFEGEGRESLEEMGVKNSSYIGLYIPPLYRRLHSFQAEASERE